MAEPQAARQALRPCGSSRRAQKPFGEEIVVGQDARQAKKYPPPTGLMYSSSCSPLRRACTEGSCGQIRLKADNSSHVELAGGRRPAR